MLSFLLKTARLAGGTGVGRAALVGLAATFRTWSRIVHALWLQITGVFFVLFATLGMMAAVREYRAYEAGDASPARVVAIALFAALFGYFGVSSFWRASRR